MSRVTLLFVRRADDVGPAAEAVSNMLAASRRRGHVVDDDEVAGILVDERLGTDLPDWPLDEELPPLGIRESAGVSGVWTYAWVDGSILQQAADADTRRDAIRAALNPPALLPWSGRS